MRQGMSAQQHGEILKPGFHITAPDGWMNDPNGMFQSQQGVYHIFYQVTWQSGCLSCWQGCALHALPRPGAAGHELLQVYGSGQCLSEARIGQAE